MNTVHLLGIMAQDAVQNTLPSGLIGAILNLQVVENFGDRQDVSVIEVKAWGKLAEFALQYCKKGKQFFIEGRIKVDSWISKDSGKTLTRMSVTARQINFTTAQDPVNDPAPMIQESKRISPQQEAYNRNVSREFAPSPQKTVDGNLLDNSELPF